MAVELNIHRNGSSPSVGTNLATYGATGTYQTTGGVDISSGDPIQVQLSYDGNNTVVESLTDLSTKYSWSQLYNQNISSVLGYGTSAWVGFTVASGNSGADQQITNFSINNLSGLSAATHLTISSGGTLDLATGRDPDPGRALLYRWDGQHGAPGQWHAHRRRLDQHRL